MSFGLFLGVFSQSDLALSWIRLFLSHFWIAAVPRTVVQVRIYEECLFKRLLKVVTATYSGSGAKVLALASSTVLYRHGRSGNTAYEYWSNNATDFFVDDSDGEDSA